MKLRLGKRNFLLGAFIYFSFSFAIIAQAAPFDFDSNGTSDPSTVAIRNNDALAWRTRIAGDNTTLNNNFGRKGYHLAPGKYTQIVTQLGNISPAGLWSVAGAGGFSYGQQNALYIAGADFDGNGQADAAYASNVCENKRSRLNFKINPFSTNSELSFQVGKGLHYKLYLDLEGDGRDEICWTRPTASNGKLTQRFLLVCKNVLQNKRVARINLKRLFAQPVPLRNDIGGDYIVTKRERNNGTIVFVYNKQGTLVRRAEFSQKGTMVLGKFISGPSEQIVIVNDNQTGQLYNINTGTFQQITFPAGIPYDYFNVNYFSTKNKSKECFCNTRVINKTKGKCLMAPGSGGAPAQENFRDGNEGNLWKPVAESGYPEHDKQLVILLHRRYQQVFDYCEVPLKSGEMHRLVVRPPYVFTNPDRQTWRATVPCERVAEVFATCYRGNEKVTFSVDPSLRSQVCTRHD